MRRNNVEKNSPPAVVISTGGSLAAFDVVRPLSLAGICTTVASSQPDDVAFYSKYCAEKIVLPPFQRSNEEQIAQQLVMYAQKQKEPPVLYYTSDAELAFIWRNRERLSAWYRFLLPPDLLLEYLFNKTLFCDFAKGYNLPIPETIVVKDTENLETLISSVAYPCIVKPAYTQDWVWDTEEQRRKFGPYKKALRRISSKEELIDFCRALPRRQSGYLIQSYIEGSDENILSFHGYFDENSQCLGYFVGKKIRTYPPHTGGSAYVRTLYHPTLAQLSIECLQQIQFKGIVKIDFKWDQRSEEFKIMEMNPRYSLWEVVGALAGMNLAYIAYEHQRGKEVMPRMYYKNDVRYLYFKQDVRAFFGGYRANGEWTLKTYLVSLRRKKYYRIFDRKDMRPFLKSSFSFIGRNVRRLFGVHEQQRPTTHNKPALSEKKQTPVVPAVQDAVDV